MKSVRLDYPMGLLCRAFGKSRSGFYAWLNRGPSPRVQEDERLKVAIKAVHVQTRETYGPLRVQPELAAQGFEAGRDRIMRLRQELDLRCKQKRKFKATTNSRLDFPVAENLLNQTFAPMRPYEVWLTDFTLNHNNSCLREKFDMSLALSSNNEIQLLSTSAAFAMSLGAKELFHTNFLAFLLESDDPNLVRIQLAIREALGFQPGQGAAPKCAVWREKNSLDLLVVELRQAPSPSATQRESSAAEGIRTASREVPNGDDEDAPEESGGKSDGWDWNLGAQWTQSAGAGTSVAAAPGTPRYIPTNRVLIVEAKLKSIPRLDQLTEYDDQLHRRSIRLEYPEDAAVPAWTLRVGGGNAITVERKLLSVSGVSMTTPASVTRPPNLWVGVTWNSLQHAMSRIIGTLATSPMSQTLNDYINSLGALVVLIDRVHRLCDDAYSTPGRVPTYGAIRNQPLDAQFRSLRINDLLGKTLFDYWLNTHLLPNAPISVPTGWFLNSYVHYSNGVPGLGVELVNHVFRTPTGAPIGLRIGVQIQNCEFRLFVDVKPGWTGLESWIANHPLLRSQWFSTPVFNTTPVGYRGMAVMSPPRAGRATNLKTFGTDRFLYSKRDIDNETVVDVGHELRRVIAIAADLAPKL